MKAPLVGNIAAARFAQTDIIHHTLDQRSAQNVHEVISVPDEIKIQCRVMAEKYLAKDIQHVADVLLVIIQRSVVAQNVYGVLRDISVRELIKRRSLVPWEHIQQVARLFALNVTMAIIQHI